jgi:hypothetical protein
MRLRSPHPAVSAAALACATLLTAAIVVPPREARGEAAAFCSIVLPWDSRGAGPFFLGKGTADSMPVRMPEAEVSGDAGHAGPGGRRAPYGQVVEVVRTGGELADSLERVFARRGSRRVVVVPWDHDDTCAASFWMRSVLFAPRSAGVFTTALRPDTAWTDGVPTFDAWQASHGPWPHGYQRTGRPEGEWLTAEEFFDFYAALPVYRPGPKEPEMTPQMERWRAEHPELAERHPAAEAIRELTTKRGW